MVWISFFALTFAIEARAQSGVWIGQDGHDLVGPSSIQEPSGVQDIRISLRGLPPQAVESATIRGLGGDEWQVNGPFGPWKAALVRSPGASSADLYLEPGRVESGRPMTVDIRFAGGQVARIDVRGGRAEPDLRMPGTELAVHWLGQDGQDRTGIGPSVGPDGRQDVHLALANLSPRVEVKSVVVETPGLVAWESGTNPKGRNNAEFVRKGDDPSRAALFFQADDDLARRPLTVKIAYGNGKSDSARITAGKVDPKLAMPGVSAPSVEFVEVSARWLGQDGSVVVGGGDIHVEVSGLPRVPAVAAALSDPGTACWAWRGDSTPSFESGMGAEPLAFRQGSDPTRAELFFPAA